MDEIRGVEILLTLLNNSSQTHNHEKNNKKEYKQISNNMLCDFVSDVMT
jgi:hypothetical protein